MKISKHRCLHCNDMNSFSFVVPRPLIPPYWKCNNCGTIGWPDSPAQLKLLGWLLRTQWENDIHKIQ